jgi:uncharacterized protein (DUF305 family)
MKGTDRPEVENLAGAIAATQQGEIRTMKEMLEERGAEAPEGAAHEGGHSH